MDAHSLALSGSRQVLQLNDSIMFEESNRKLQRTRHQFSEVIAELDRVLDEVRALRGAKLGQDGAEAVEGEPEWIRRLVQQRQVLRDVAAQIAEMRLDWVQ